MTTKQLDAKLDRLSAWLEKWSERLRKIMPIVALGFLILAVAWMFMGHYFHALEDVFLGLLTLYASTKWRKK